MKGRPSVAIGTATAIVRANLPPDRTRRPWRCRSIAVLAVRIDPNADHPRVCPGRSRWRRQQHADVAAAIRADLRDHVLPDPAPAAEENEGSPGAGEEHP